MVNLARTHHPNNCLQDNRNHLDNSNVATTDFLSSFCTINDVITTSIDSIECIAYDRNSQIPCQKQQQHRNQWKRCIKNYDDGDSTRNSDSNGSSDCYHYHRRACQYQRYNHKNMSIFQCNRMQRHRAAGVLSRVHDIIGSTSNLFNFLLFFAVFSLVILNIDVINAEPQQPIKATAATTIAKSSSSPAAAAAAAGATKMTATSEQQCEPKVLDETPPDPVS